MSAWIETPTKAGYWWVRKKGQRAISLWEVVLDHGRLLASNGTLLYDFDEFPKCLWLNVKPPPKEEYIFAAPDKSCDYWWDMDGRAWYYNKKRRVLTTGWKDADVYGMYAKLYPPELMTAYDLKQEAK